MVREVFDLARDRSPSIVFVDEIDAIASKRQDTSTSGDREVQRTMMQFLAKLDGFEPRGEVKILGATNRPDMLDEAILRPGRFDRLIEFPLPTKEERQAIFKIHTRDMSLEEDINFRKLVRKTGGTTGADIKAICTEAGIQAIREKQDKVSEKDFLKAISKVKSGENTSMSGKMFG